MIALMLGMSLVGGVHAASEADEAAMEMATGVIQLSVVMNELALACGEVSEQELAQLRDKQREAAIKDMKVPAAQYEALYEKFTGEFKQSWSSGSDSQRKEACEQMRSMPR